jgi:LmbE family N-acetylglucosaminyl deacetylase
VSAPRRLRTRMLLKHLETRYARHAPGPSRPLPRGGWRRAMIVAPHADDEVIGCGGLVRRLVEDGAEVLVLVLTRDGERSLGTASSGAAERRIAESHAAQGFLGYAERRQLAFSDRSLSLEDGPRSELVAALAAELRRADPDLVAFPNADDLHPDHAAAAGAARAAWQGLAADEARWARRTALAYEVWGPCQADWHLPLDDTVIDRKRKALGCYASQLEIADYDHVMAFVHERRAGMLPLGSSEGLAGRPVWAEGYEWLTPGGQG